MNILIFLIILLVLVVSHEFGHFIIAKKSGIRVDEFSFGFPPKLFGKKIGETTYNFNALPLGGYVKIFGENPDEESLNGPDSKRSFVNKPWYIQAAVLLGGVTMNFLVAWILITGLYTAGTNLIFDDTLPAKFMKDTHLVVAGVSKDMPAEVSGLKPGDVISVASYSDKSKTLESYTTKSFTEFIRNSNGLPIDLEVVRNSEVQTIQIVPTKVNDNYMIGVAPNLQGHVKLPIVNAIGQGFHSSAVLVKETARGLFNLIIGKESFEGVSGPVGMVGIVGAAVKMGFEYIVFFTAIISLNLAVINLVPFPALDGGRLLFLLIEKIKGSRITPKVANTFNIVGFGLLMLLMVVVTYNDVVKLF